MTDKKRGIFIFGEAGAGKSEAIGKMLAKSVGFTRESAYNDGVDCEIVVLDGISNVMETKEVSLRDYLKATLELLPYAKFMVTSQPIYDKMDKDDWLFLHEHFQVKAFDKMQPYKLRDVHPKDVVFHGEFAIHRLIPSDTNHYFTRVGERHFELMLGLLEKEKPDYTFEDFCDAMTIFDEEGNRNELISEIDRNRRMRKDGLEFKSDVWVYLRKMAALDYRIDTSSEQAKKIFYLQEATRDWLSEVKSK